MEVCQEYNEEEPIEYLFLQLRLEEGEGEGDDEGEEEEVESLTRLVTHLTHNQSTLDGQREGWRDREKNRGMEG